VSTISNDLINVIDADGARFNARKAGVAAPKAHRIHDVASDLCVRRASECSH
jgi:hypothetical protein